MLNDPRHDLRFESNDGSIGRVVFGFARGAPERVVGRVEAKPVEPIEPHVPAHLPVTIEGPAVQLHGVGHGWKGDAGRNTELTQSVRGGVVAAAHERPSQDRKSHGFEHPDVASCHGHLNCTGWRAGPAWSGLPGDTRDRVMQARSSRCDRPRMILRGRWAYP